MRFTYSEIKEEIQERFSEISESEDLDHTLSLLADELLPVYNIDVISDWKDMPSDYDDAWKDYPTTASDGIIRFMTLDLYNYYLSQVTRAYGEIREEQEFRNTPQK
jgi:hypothetical protein